MNTAQWQYYCLIVIINHKNINNSKKYIQMKTSIIIIYFLIKSITNTILNCNYCGNAFASTELYTNQQSSESLNKDHQFNLKLFKSKQGKYFKVLTLSQANLQCQNTFYIQDSFFPGYMWAICLCPICKNHLGWMFYPDKTICSLKKDEYKVNKCKGRSLFYGVYIDNVKNKAISFNEKIEI